MSEPSDEAARQQQRWNDVIDQAERATAGRMQYWITGPKIFDAEQLTRLKSLVEAENSAGLIEGSPNEELLKKVRRSKILRLAGSSHNWVYEIIVREAVNGNSLLQADILPLCEEIQLSMYDSGERGHFAWHNDVMPSNMTRKLSISVPLNDDSEYEGGRLEFDTGGTSVQPQQRAGVPIMFPSWLFHRVSPVTAGRRYSLVAWIRGPNWR